MSTINTWILIWALGGIINISYLKISLRVVKKDQEKVTKLDNRIERLDKLLQEIDILCTDKQLYMILYIMAFIMSWGLLGAMIASKKDNHER